MSGNQLNVQNNHNNGRGKGKQVAAGLATFASGMSFRDWVIAIGVLIFVLSPFIFDLPFKTVLFFTFLAFVTVRSFVTSAIDFKGALLHIGVKTPILMGVTFFTLLFTFPLIYSFVNFNRAGDFLSANGVQVSGDVMDTTINERIGSVSGIGELVALLPDPALISQADNTPVVAVESAREIDSHVPAQPASAQPASAQVVDSNVGGGSPAPATAPAAVPNTVPAAVPNSASTEVDLGKLPNDLATALVANDFVAIQSVASQILAIDPNHPHATQAIALVEVTKAEYEARSSMLQTADRSDVDEYDIAYILAGESYEIVSDGATLRHLQCKETAVIMQLTGTLVGYQFPVARCLISANFDAEDVGDTFHVQ